MEITNQVFGSNPQFLYAMVETPISGGTSRFISFIGEEDANAARERLVQKAVGEYRERLEEQGLILADRAFVAEPEEFTMDKPVGTETPSYEARIKVRVTGMVFDRASMESLIEERMSQTLASNRSLKMDTGNIEYQVTSLDMNNEVGVISAHFDGLAVLKVDLGNVAPELAGKSREQANEILRSKAEVDKIEMVLAPAWQNNFPYLAEKIEVRVIE